MIHYIKKIPIFKFIGNLIHYRFVLKNFVIRDLKYRYKSSVLGFFWTILHPLVLMLFYSFIFSNILQFKIENYPVFLLSALIPWIFFSTSLEMASYSLTDNFGIINKVYFPRELFPTSIVIHNLLHFLLSLFVFSFFLFYFKVQLTWAVLFLPVIVLIQLCLTLALALIVSSLAVFFRDITLMVNLILQMGFFLCPIVYSIAYVPEKYLGLYHLNPLVGIFEGYKSLILNGSLPSFSSIAYPALFSVTLFIAVYVFFKKIEPLFAERG